jgi:phosphoglycolate phosphatase
MKKPMIEPSEVNLLIFDLDGTIHPATKPEIEAIRRAYRKLNIEDNVTERSIEKYIGFTSDVFWKAITPQDRQLSWQEIRSAVRNEYASSMRDFAILFPQVKETLEVLRARGYLLALCSNSSIAWFTSAISSLGIREHFDYLECSQDNNLNKIQMVQKIKSRFGNLETAVIGDRATDIEAARENNALSIGALYGHGGEEPKQADINISTFSDLLGIFDRKLAIFKKVLDEATKMKLNYRALIIGVTGIDTSGKTRFAEALSEFLISKGHKTQLINLDDFHNPKSIRYSGQDQVENYYNKSFDLLTLIQKLLIPIRSKRKLSTELTLLDLATDKYEVSKKYSVDENTIVVFEGVFLFRNELSEYIDYKIFLEIPFEESKNRAATRDVPVYGEEVLKRYDEKYLPAQKRYIDHCHPMKMADMIIDNLNWQYPTIKYLR